MKTKVRVTLIGVLFLALCSCSTPKKIAYMQDAQNGEVKELSALTEIRVRPGDKLSIVVNSKDPLLADLFNLPVLSHRVGSGNNSNAYTNQYVSYYTVDPNGDIDFPVLGKIHVAGMTRHELAEYIKKRLVSEDLLKDPVITIEYIDTAVSVMGEVSKPGRYEINKDRLSILEALSMAGDLTIQGKRENVLVIRTEGGKEYSYRIDLTDQDAMQNSPVYYLQQNDVVYVEPNNMKKRSSTVNGNNVLSASFWVSIASLLTSVAVLVFK